jgi:hypothetical protein
VTRGRILALLAALLAVSAALTVYALPRWLDWDRHRVTLAAIASERLGRPVAVTGPISFVLLPQPRMEAEGLLIGWANDDIRMTARGIRLRLALPALLLGRIEVREMALLGAVINLPWPPTTLPGLVQPPWLAALDARIEDSRIIIGGAVVEGVSARLRAGRVGEALTAQGSLAWGGRPMRFQATLQSASDDGVGALDFQGEVQGATIRARGALLPEGGFDGRLEAEGPRLAALIPAPPGAFRATADLEAGAERLIARNLALQFGEQRVRGSATLTLGPASEFQVALAAPSLDVEPWLAALRGTTPPPIPVSLDMAAEQSRLGPLALRRLRASARLDGERLRLSNVSAELPGGTEISLSGTGQGALLDLALAFRSAEPAVLADAVGWPASLHPGAGDAQGQFRLVVDGPQYSVSDLQARWGATRAAGGFVWRAGARPSLALGLEMDALEVEQSASAVLAALRDASGGADVQMRLGFARLSLDGAVFERLALDGAAEAGRMLLRRLTMRHLGLDFTATGTLDGQRLTDLALEAEGPAGPLLARLGLRHPGLAALPLRLRASGAGPLEELALRVEAELADARLAVQARIDTGARTGQGNLTLRHPGAARLLGRFTDGAALEWLGEGSFSLVAALTHRPGEWAAESLELVAGHARGRGQLALTMGGPRPMLSGQLAFEHLPLPPVDQWHLGGVGALGLDIALTAARVEMPGLPAVSDASAGLRAGRQFLRMSDARGAMLDGEVQLEAHIDAPTEAGGAPRVGLVGAFDNLALTGPIFGWPVDVTAGRLAGSFRLMGEGTNMGAIRRSMSGTVEITLRDGVVGGFDAPVAVAALGWEDTAAAEATLRRALTAGATNVERGLLRLRLHQGTAWITDGELRGEAGLNLRLGGHFGVAEDGLALRLDLPVPANAPGAGADILGRSHAPDIRPDIEAFLRWRAQVPR